ncbi:MAG: FAD:protein FMN transferase [Spirochaetaceae bacterium]|nr:MAG: FAD:protein FMN transferase [Spirochaetaceae bacterium]
MKTRFRVAAFVAAALLALLTVSCVPRTIPRVSQTELLLGTAVTITVQQAGASRDMLGGAFARTKDIQNRMSINDAAYDDTEVLRVNAAAGESRVRVSPDTFRVIAEGVRFGELSDGAFDLTVEPLIRLWGFGRDEPRVPDPDALAQVLRLVDFRRIELFGDTFEVFLPDQSMGIDVGGIAKGFAADEAAAVLRSDGVRHAILDFGGDIVTIGPRPDGAPWRIGIQYPTGERGRYLGILQSRDESVVTSGAYERFFVQDGVRYHHIFDTRTGMPSDSGVVSATVIGESAMKTDALSTAAFVMGVEAALAMVRDLPGYDAIIATADTIYMTPGVSKRFESRADDYRVVVVER